MQSNHGKRTGEFGLWLTRYLKSVSRRNEYMVFYDHGDSQVEPNVAETKGFFGRKVTNANRLASVDVMVAKANKELVALIEIEERPVSPKKLLGDIFAILMCNGFAVKVDEVQKYFAIGPKTQLIIAGTVPAQGRRREKIEKVIGPRLSQFKAPGDAIDPGNVSLIFTGNLQSTLETLKGEVKKIFPD